MHATNFVNYYLRLTLSTLHFGYQSLSPPRKSKLAGKADSRGVESARKINEVCRSSLSRYPSLYPSACLCGLWVHVCGGPRGVARWGNMPR